MNKFDSYFDNQAVVFNNIDRPVYKRQLEIVNSELCEYISNSSNKWDKLLGKYYEYITHDHYGSLVFVFKAEVLNLKPASQSMIIESLNDCFMNSEFNQNLMYIYIQEEYEDNNNEPQNIGTYMDTLIDLGYTVHLGDMLDTFSDICGESLVGQEFLIRQLKHPELCIT